MGSKKFKKESGQTDENRIGIAMGKKVDFKINIKGLREIMLGPAMKGVLQSKGEQIESIAQGMCPKGKYKTRTVGGYHIATTYVSVQNYEAIKDNYEHNTLVKARDSAKG